MTDVLVEEPPAELIETSAPDRPRRRWRATFGSGKGLAGLALVAVVLLAGLFAPVLARYAPQAQLPGANLLGPSGAHWFGTDELNRDIFARVLHGIRVDLLITFVAVPAGAIVGAAAGLLSTVHRAADVVLQRAFDVLLAFPGLILAIGLTAVAGPGVLTIGVVVVAVEIPLFGRLLRAEVLRAREAQFVEAAEVIGARRWWILRTHVVPNALEPLIVQLALSMSVAVFVEGAMSFLGIGVRPPEPSLGSILNTSLNYLDLNPMFAIGPLLVTAALVLGFQLIAQAVGAARRTS
jgi:peptide/nickel transport system permease protein